MTITKLTDKGYLINGKAIYQNENGKWASEYKLTEEEKKNFKKHLETI